MKIKYLIPCIFFAINLAVRANPAVYDCLPNDHKRFGSRAEITTNPFERVGIGFSFILRFDEFKKEWPHYAYKFQDLKPYCQRHESAWGYPMGGGVGIVQFTRSDRQSEIFELGGQLRTEDSSEISLGNLCVWLEGEKDDIRREIGRCFTKHSDELLLIIKKPLPGLKFFYRVQVQGRP